MGYDLFRAFTLAYYQPDFLALLWRIFSPRLLLILSSDLPAFAGHRRIFLKELTVIGAGFASVMIGLSVDYGYFIYQRSRIIQAACARCNGIVFRISLDLEHDGGGVFCAESEQSSRDSPNSALWSGWVSVSGRL